VRRCRCKTRSGTGEHRGVGALPQREYERNERGDDTGMRTTHTGAFEPISAWIHSMRDEEQLANRGENEKAGATANAINHPAGTVPAARGAEQAPSQK
jgi:hypothetical protein